VLLYVVALLILLLAVAVVSYPLVFQPAEAYRLANPPPAEFSERDALLDAIDDLEHSFHSGKVSPADYEAQRARLEVQYVAVLEAAEVKETSPGGAR
jgi:hypothetical protein